MSKYANVIVDISHEKVDRPFGYRVPDALQDVLQPGMRVQIPFGTGNTLRTGYVTELTDESDYPPEKMKYIHSLTVTGGTQDGVQDPREKMIALAAWMKQQYGSTMIQALKTVLPARTKAAAKEKKEIRLLVDKEQAQVLLSEYERKHQKAKARLLTELIQSPVLPRELVTQKLAIPAATLKGLQENGIIAQDSKTVLRNPVKLGDYTAPPKLLSKKQQEIVTRILQNEDSGVTTPALIHGITGSGKTEVYLALIEGILKRGKQAIVLIPEIALTYQTLMRFYGRFGDRVSVINSTLSPGEKQDQCERARRGEIDVIIGPRSALFTPFPRLGMILIDEEHENSYKSETMPRYHARETALKLAELHGAQVVMGSATPSLESYARARQGEFLLFTLKERLTGGQLPKVYVEDLRRELKEGNRSIFSRRLQEKMEQRLKDGEQTMLFLNRRGYAGFVSCRACGYVCKCPHCDVSLSEHKNGTLVCHYCGYTIPAVKLCPSCGSRYILGFKAGTEAIEEQLKRLYPQAKVLRMDADTTRTKESSEKILSAFANKEADILVGTQMIVKGHDFPDVTLVGVLAADLSLSVNDYRAGERTFQLLTQAAGRAGRGTKPGEVVLQTYQPEHYSVQYAKKADYEGFFEEELLYRQLLSYPPASHLLAVLLSAPIEAQAQLAAAQAAEWAKTVIDKNSWADAVLIGPAPAAVGKINDIYRYGVYIKHKDYQKLVKIKDHIEKQRTLQKDAKGMCQFDFDPVNTW